MRSLLLARASARRSILTVQSAAGVIATTTSSSSLFHSSSRMALPETANEQKKHWADPVARQYKFWNREADANKAGKYSYLIEMSPESIQQEAKILSLSEPDDPANEALHKGELPLGSSLLGIGTSVEEFASSIGKEQKPNVLFCSPSCPHTATVLPQVLQAYPSIKWVHCRSAGIDYVSCDALTEICETNGVQITNAKGQFSSSLAEYALLAFSYFAKDLPRMMKQQKAKHWENFNIEELRGKTLGIIGYGDIGRACAKLATVYGMRIVALRRHPFLSKNDPFCDVVYGRDKGSLNALMAESDYIVCSTPSTVETRGMVSAEAFEAVKKNAVFVNLGRGPVVDEAALTQALTSGNLKGAALDVFVEEPLPRDSKLWELDNVLVSPHNMDQTKTFMHEATEFFLRENLPRFVCKEDLLNPVDPKLGY